MKNMKHILIALFCLLTPTTWAANSTPADSYQAFIKTLRSANSLSDLDKYFPKRAVETRNKIIDALPNEGDRAQVYQRILDELKLSMGKTKVNSAKEDTSRTRGKSPAGNETAIVALDGIDVKTGKPIERWPIMELEDGVWKFSGSVSAPNLPPAAAEKASKLATMPAKSSGSVVVEPLPSERDGHHVTR